MSSSLDFGVWQILCPNKDCPAQGKVPKRAGYISQCVDLIAIEAHFFAEEPGLTHRFSVREHRFQVENLLVHEQMAKFRTIGTSLWD